MAKRYDAVVIGGGHNGLITAAYLAKAGKSVVVLEKNAILGGAATTVEHVPGFRFSAMCYVVSLLRPEIIRELELPKHGLEILPLDGTITPLEDDYLWRVNDHGKTVRELRRWSKNDAEAYEEYGQLMAEMARFIKPILSIVPPDPGKISPTHWLPLGPLAKSFRDLPQKLQTTFIQLMTMSAADFLDQWFETEPLKATMSASGIIGTFQGPRSPGTAYVLLHHYMGEIDGAFRAWGIPKGGTGGISYSIANAALSLGAEIRTETKVTNIITRGGRAIGVALEGGEEVHADVVMSSLDSRLDVHPPAREGHPGPRLRVRRDALQVPRLERQGEPRARRPARARVQARPRRVAARRDLVLAEPRLHGARVRRREVRELLEAPVHRLHHPDARRPDDGASRQAHDELLRAVRAVPPGRRQRVDARAAGRVRRDRDRHARGAVPRHPRARSSASSCSRPRTSRTGPGLSEGNIFQGELSLEQLFFNRPVPGWARYRTPVPDLWMCGSATHPGGGIMGANGRLAALEYLKEKKKGRRAA